MLNVDVAGSCSALPQLCATVWYCGNCNTLVSIQSSLSINEAFCPACTQAPLEFCGRFSGIPGFQFGDA